MDDALVTPLHGADSPSLPPPSRRRWQLLRLGVQNLWEYDVTTRFVARDGRLLLRGHNESGKTKAVELTVPATLDAILRPERLDPFGEQSRLMRANLIGPHTPAHQRVVIGYAWVEFGRLDDAGQVHFATYGYGVRASRTAAGHTAWYFRSDRRIDLDVHLFVDGRPLTAAQLEEALAGAGRVFVDDRDGYRREVNRTLFALEDFGQFDKLMDLLLELRQPGLGKRLRAEDLSDMLSASLPGLDLELLANVADGFSRLEEHRAELESLRETCTVLARFNTTYRRYLRTAVAGDAAEVRTAESQVDGASTRLRQAIEERDRLVADVASNEEEAAELGRSIAALEERLETLKGTEAFRASESLAAARRQADARRQDAERARRRSDEDQRGEQRAAEVLARRQEEAEAEKAAATTAEAGAAGCARPAELGTDHRQAAERAGAGDLQGAEALVRTALAQLRARIDELAPHDAGVVAAEAAVTAADARSTEVAEQAEQEAREAEGAEADLRVAIDDQRRSVAAWAQATSELPVDDELAEELATVQVDRGAEVAREAGRRHQQRLGQDLAVAHAEGRRATDQRDEVAAERAALEAEAFSPPVLPGWRRRDPARAGAPLYLVAEFRAGVSPEVAAAVEAALEDAGLLDAWVSPDGAVHAVDGDITLVPRHPGEDRAPSPSLLDVLRPVAAAGVSEEVAGRALGAVGYGAGPHDQPGAAPAWVAADGRWQAGRVVGRRTKAGVAYVGEEARRRARERRLAELAEALGAAERLVAELAAAAERLAGRIAAVDDDLDAFPAIQPVVEARVAASAAHRRAERSRAEAAKAAEALTSARAAAARATYGRDQVAARVGLILWAGRLDDLRRLAESYDQAAERWLAAARLADGARRRAGDAGEVAASARSRWQRSGQELATHQDDLARAEERVATLDALVGADAQAVVAQVGQAEGELSRSRRSLAAVQQQAKALAGDQGRAEQRVADAEERHAEARHQRGRAAERFRRLAAAGLVAAAVELDADALPEGSPLEWAERPTLEVARRVAQATVDVEADEEARNRREAAVQRSFQQLTVALPPELQLTPDRTLDVLTYSVVYGRAERSTLELGSLLAADVAERERRLDDDDRALIDRFLSGEIRDDVRRTLVEAQTLIDDINEQLVARHTPSGQRVRLDWELDPDAPAGTAEALGLLRSTPGVHASGDAALREFLHQRLDTARREEDGSSLVGRLADVLDYRQWHRFVVKQRKGDDAPWSPLTRKVHGEGSGGSKSATLHLPLFAAAAAFYASAGDLAPRLVALDEAFAGIDDQTTAKLLDLTVAWDFDLVMTGWREWMCFPEVPGLAIYEIVRDKDAHVVDTEWWTWDGQVRREMAS